MNGIRGGNNGVKNVNLDMKEITKLEDVEKVQATFPV
jgi:hypothetical protein